MAASGLVTRPRARNPTWPLPVSGKPRLPPLACHLSIDRLAECLAEIRQEGCLEGRMMGRPAGRGHQLSRRLAVKQNGIREGSAPGSTNKIVFQAALIAV